MAQKKSTDLGAALRGLILGGASMFLLLLTIVWLTNRHFAGKKEAGPAPAPAAATAAAGTPGTGAPPIPVSPEAAAGKPGPAPPPPPAPSNRK
jgi:hypothetical protein